MAWLRLDDLFLENGKVSELNDTELRWHLRTMLYAARNRTSGFLKPGQLREMGMTATRRARFLSLGLWEECDIADGVYIHDWDKYNPADPTAAERMRQWRERNHA